MKRHSIYEKTILLCIGWLCTASQFAAEVYLEAQPRPGEGLTALLRRYGLPATETYRQKFYELNGLTAKTEPEGLMLGQAYKLPITRHRYDGKSIRSTLGLADEALAKSIESFNQAALQAGLRVQSYKLDRDLWRPWGEGEKMSSSQRITYPLFGRAQQVVERRDNQLQDCVFYLVSGHGGPDPGAIGKRGWRRLCEDEYAYDITLRLARRLMEHGARVQVIVQDPNDGIRSGKYLKGDQDERYLGGTAISSDPVQRLRMRASIINSLYRQDKKSTRQQFAVVLHIDSRSHTEPVDIFYYYHPGSDAGRNLAETLFETVRQKYAVNQPGRSYQSTVTARNLHMLRETEPTAVFIELGNIQNKRDQERLIVDNNRQAIANWLCTGLIEACRKTEK